MINITLLLDILKRSYPNARCSLNYKNPFELLVATILSAQCTDERVNQVTKTLFQKYPSPKAFAEADLQQIAKDIRPTGFFRNKAESIQKASEQILLLYQGEVPRRMEDLVKLRGVGRKTANVIMGNAFGMAEGIVVDTHVARLSRRLGLTHETQPEKIEKALMQLIPVSEWVIFPHLVIAHGRAVCKARSPACDKCPLSTHCPSSPLKKAE